MADPGMRRIGAALAPQGIEIAGFNFPYRERGSRPPDPMRVLQERFRSAVADARPRLQGERLLIGGRSMGGRVASMMAAEQFPCDGLLLFAYPLHPPGQPQKLRTAHLSKIRVPVLCFNGTRDAFCTRNLMERALEDVQAPWTMHWLEGADHSFRVPKSSPEGEGRLWSEIGAASRRWLESARAKPA